jgi:hypothetical protein
VLCIKSDFISRRWLIRSYDWFTAEERGSFESCYEGLIARISSWPLHVHLAIAGLWAVRVLEEKFELEIFLFSIYISKTSHITKISGWMNELNPGAGIVG